MLSFQIMFLSIFIFLFLIALIVEGLFIIYFLHYLYTRIKREEEEMKS